MAAAPPALPPDAQPFSVTVKVPFAGDRTVNTTPDVTVARLTEMVLSTCQPDAFLGVPQCIVRSGRILADSATLREAGVSDGAVLHLMRRPSDARDAAGPPPRAAANPSAGPGDASPDREHAPAHAQHEHPEEHHDHDHHHFHEHEHDFDHHIHTNVVIGHIAVGGRIRYSDAHDVLLSVLHAVGFSTRAVTSAAAVAAAIAVATEASEERGSASRTILNTAWNAAYRTQQNLARITAPPTPAPAQPPASHRLQRASHEVLLGGSQRDNASAAPTSEQGMGVEEAWNVPDEDAIRDVAGHTDLPETTAASESLPPRLTPQTPGPSALAPDPPQVQSGESDLVASARATDRLLPALATMMEGVAARMRNASTLVGIEGTQRVAEAEALLEQLGSLASAVTAVTTLMSTVLPDPDAINTDSSGAQTGHQNGGEGNASNGLREEQRLGDDTATRTEATSAHETPSHEGSYNTPRTSEAAQENGARPESGAAAVSAAADMAHTTNSVSSGSTTVAATEPRAAHAGASSSTPSLQQNGATDRSGVVHGSNSASGSRGRRSRRVRVSSSQAANADFLIRVLSYYMCSLSDSILPQGAVPEGSDGQTAVSVMNELYGRGGTARPTNAALSVVHRVMETLTPEEFHAVCRGNLMPIATIRKHMWDAIQEQLSSRVDQPLEPPDIEELFVDHVCEALHEFVHLLESADQRNEDDRYHPGADDFCHHIMHTIQGKTISFLDILTRQGSDAEFAKSLSRWVRDAIGEVLVAIAMELEMEWDGLLLSFRRASYDIGRTVVGGQFSVIFPFLANVFANRARSEYERCASQNPEARRAGLRTGAPQSGQEADGEFDHSNCGPGCESRQEMLREAESTNQDQSASNDVVEVPRSIEGSNTPDFRADSEENEDVEEDYGEDDEGDDWSEQSDADDEDMEDLRQMEDVAEDSIKNGVDLDEDEIDQLVAELDREYRQERVESQRSAGLSDSDCDELAKELEAERAALREKGTASSIHSAKPTTVPLGSAKRMAGMPSASASSLRNPAIGSGLAPTSTLRTSGVNRAAFASAAVSRARGTASFSVSDDFKQLLGPQEGLKWKRVVSEDETRIQAERRGPLSRGYQGQTSQVPPLTEDRAAVLVVESAKEAAKAARLSEGQTDELLRVASDSGPQYLREMERAIGSRLLADPDFDREKFPKAAKRFLPPES